MIVKLDRGWEFCKEGKVFSPVSLPHDAMLGERRSPTALSGEAGAFFPGGKYRYQKKLTFSSEELEKDISLLFEGVYRNAEVLLNGTKVGAPSPTAAGIRARASTAPCGSLSPQRTSPKPCGS